MKEFPSQISTRNPADGRTMYTVHTALGSRPGHACHSLCRGLVIDEGHGDLAFMHIDGLANIATRNARVMVKVARVSSVWKKIPSLIGIMVPISIAFPPYATRAMRERN